MARRHRLNKANHSHIAGNRDPAKIKDREEFADQMAKARDRGIANWYLHGGKLFIQWTKQNYRKADGQPLHWHECFQEEYFLGLGNPYFQRFIVQKSAQIGFTESLIAFCGFMVALVRVPTALGFEQQQKLLDVSPRLQRSFDNCRPIQVLKNLVRQATKREDTDTKSRKISVGGVELTLFYVSTVSSKKAGDGDRQVTSSTSSFTAWVVAADEIEAYAPGVLDILTQRQNACEMPSKPLRGGSTPGGLGGIIDMEIKHARYLFQWQVSCPHCGRENAIRPFSNFIKPFYIESNSIVSEHYLDISGRPQRWFCLDEEGKPYDWNREGINPITIDRKIDTAYVGCRYCEGELNRDTLNRGRFICQKTNLPLRDVCADLIAQKKVIKETVAIAIPRLASIQFIASERIAALLSTENPVDEVQQGLGEPCSVGQSSISEELLLKCVGLPLPANLEAEYDCLTVLGVDQGRAAHYAVACRIYFPKRVKDKDIRIRDAVVEVFWWKRITGEVGELTFDVLDPWVESLGINWIGMDAKPEVHAAGAYCKHNLPYECDRGQVILFEQQDKISSGENFKRKMKSDRRNSQKKRRLRRDTEGENLPFYNILRTYYLDLTRNKIATGQMHFPSGLKVVPGDPDNLLYSYTVSYRTEARWVATDNAPDHFHHATSFALAVAHIQQFEEAPKRLVLESGKSPFR